MSKIEEQIKELMLKQKKVQLLSCLMDYVNPTLKAEDVQDDPFSDVRGEVTELVRAFVASQIEMIEDAKLSNSSGELYNQLQFTNNEVQVLKEMVHKLLNKGTKVPVNNGAYSDENNQGELEPSDPLRFAQKHKHLDSKRVRFSTKDGNVTGVVVGLTTPHILVKTDTGYTVPVSPSLLQTI